jgi:hypothetical protein
MARCALPRHIEGASGSRMAAASADLPPRMGIASCIDNMGAARACIDYPVLNQPYLCVQHDSADERRVLDLGAGFG